MKHYIWYKADGQFCGTLSRQGGWLAGSDPSEATPSDAVAASARACVDDHPDFVGMVMYDCPCAEGTLFHTCAHADDRLKDSYHDAGAVVAKPSVDIEVDSVVTAPNTPSTPGDKTPGATVNIKLVGATVPDGEEVEVFNSGSADVHQSLPQTLTFTSGETGVLALTAPAQGMVGGIHLRGKCVTWSFMFIRGWA